MCQSVRKGLVLCVGVTHSLRACLHVPSPSPSPSLSPSNLHGANDDGPFDRENGICTSSVHQTVRFHWHNDKLWRWYDGDGTCKRAKQDDTFHYLHWWIGGTFALPLGPTSFMQFFLIIFCQIISWHSPLSGSATELDLNLNLGCIDFAK